MQILYQIFKLTLKKTNIATYKISNKLKIIQKQLLIIFKAPYLLMLTFTLSCKKLVEVTPPSTSITGGSVYNTDATAIAVLTGLYAQISSTNYYQIGFLSISEYAGLSGDELTLWSGVTNITQLDYYKNSLSSSKSGYEFWQTIYQLISTCNSAIEGLNGTNNLTTQVHNQLLGESKFMRAYFLFYLTNLYGDIAMPLTTNYKTNSTLKRTSTFQIYRQIISDLQDAINLLAENYIDGTLTSISLERVRPTKWAAEALLAKAYLYSGDSFNAEKQATLVLNNTSLFSLTTLNNTFLKNSSEAIWQLQPVTNGTITNTQDAKLFILPPTGPNNTSIGNPVYLSNSLVSSFDTNDNRKNIWTGNVTVGAKTYYYPAKYKINLPNSPVSEYATLLRLGEEYLIRAEARANQGNLSGALSDLNIIRNRAGLSNFASNSQSQVLSQISHETQVELFTEMGHRWLDIKRLKTIDTVMTIASLEKGNIWNTYQQLYPLPFTEIQKDLNLAQNPGY